VPSLPGTAQASRRLSIVLILLVVLPLVFYSAYEIASLSEGEEMMREMYRRQLDAILFSLNQHAWDVSLGWATQLDLSLRDDANSDMAALEEYLRRTPALDAVMLADSSFRDIALYQRRGDSTKTVTPATLVALMSPAHDRLNALLRFQRVDYRKLEPFVLPDTASGNGHILIVFARMKRDGGVSFAGLLFRERQFIDRAISPQLTDLASEEFLLGIFRKGGVQPINASGVVPAGAEFQRKDLWLLPGHEVGIRLQGSTVDEVVRARFTRNLLLILLLDLILLAGALLIYRSVRAQTEFAQAKSAFVSNVSHELRTPLALIRMFAETLEMGRLKDEVKKQEYYATIVRESDRLTHLVNTILNFSRMEAGKRPYQFQTMDLNEAVRSVLETYRLHLEQHGMKPLTALSASPVTVSADTDAVTEAIINLLDNAIKYSGSSTYLAVRTEIRDGKGVVEVEDHGIGIAPEHQKKVFDVFYRVPTGTVHETKGSGLGLSLVNHIMTAHNGTVELVSASGKGSTFRLVFPLSQAAGTEHHVKDA
jgi:two-component system phosphate regulon sensor histidine kinase PhoR